MNVRQGCRKRGGWRAQRILLAQHRSNHQIYGRDARDVLVHGQWLRVRGQVYEHRLLASRVHVIDGQDHDQLGLFRRIQRHGMAQHVLLDVQIDDPQELESRDGQH